MHWLKRTKELTPSEVQIGEAKRHGVPRYLAYGLPSHEGDNETRVLQYDDLDLYDIPLRSENSFLDFNGVVLFGGAFEEIRRSQSVWSAERIVACVAPNDLDLREREFYTAIQKGKFVVFLVPNIPKILDDQEVNPQVDLLRRFLKGLIHWDNLTSPVAHTQSAIPEFRAFIERYGTAYIQYRLPEEGKSDLLRPICGSKGTAFGVVFANKVFLLPCAFPQTHEQAIEMFLAGIRAADAYRNRMEKSYPEWIAEFRFANESVLIQKASAIRTELVQIESNIDNYANYKGVLCFRSEPLVQVVAALLRDFFDIDVEIEDNCIEDAVLKDTEGKILAVFEIKGVNGHFTRKNINQVDSHRERLNLPSKTPGILIMNTMMTAGSLAEKDQSPHPDIICKAATDNVLMIRTLDLLRYADYCQAGKLCKNDFRSTILCQAGWLDVRDEAARIVKK